jgi:hypothetical protein
MDTEEKKDSIIDKILINKLLKKLTSLFYEDLKSTCDSAGYHVSDLLPKPKEFFHEKGSPSEVENIRFMHFEENRIAKILKISSDIASSTENHLYRSQSTITLMKQLRIPVNSQRRGSKAASLSIPEPYKTFHKPQDVIQYNYEKEKEKYERSLNMIEKISNLKEIERKKNEMKMKMMEDREKKLRADKVKKEEEHEKNKEQRTERRKQILVKKYQIEENINEQCLEIGRQLEMRMQQLTEREKKILRDKLRRKQEKIKVWINNDFQKIVMDEMKIRQEEEKAEFLIRELQSKVEKRVKTYERNVKKRIQTARSHSIKVEQQFTKSVRDDSVKQEEKLKKIINKTLVCEEKKDKKCEKYQENAEKLKTHIERSFDRQLRGVRDINEAESRRLEEIEQRDSEKQKTFNVIKNKIEKLYEEKKYKNDSRERKHSAKYNKTQENFVRYKEKILEKHQRLSQVAEEIKVHKDLLSNLKRRRNYEVQNARSLHSSPAKPKSFSVSEGKDLESFDNS